MAPARARTNGPGRIAPGAARVLSGRARAPGATRDDPRGEVQIEPRLRTGIASPRAGLAGVAGRLRGECGDLRPRLVRPARGEPGGAAAIPIESRENQGVLAEPNP